MEGGDEPKRKIFAYIENHPYVLISVIAVLIIIIGVMYTTGFKLPTRSDKKKKEPLSSEDEIDELIESIHSKQRKKKQN